MKFTLEFNRREVCVHKRTIEASSEEEAQLMADAILEGGDIDWDVCEVFEEWLEKISPESGENK